MRAPAERAIALRLKECLPDAHGLAGFEQVLLQDGSSFALHPQIGRNISRADSISTAPLR